MLAAPFLSRRSVRRHALNATPEPNVAKLLAEIKQKDKGQLAVSEEDGRFLRLMIASSGAKRALEIGGASGYSAIWMGHGTARDRRTAGDDRIRPVARRSWPRTSSAPASPTSCRSSRATRSREIPKLPGTFDFVFLDAWKKDYKRFFDLVYPRLDKAGCSSPTTSSTSAARWETFLDAVQKHPSLWTTIVSPSGEGMSVSLKR